MTAIAITTSSSIAAATFFAAGDDELTPTSATAIRHVIHISP